MAELEFRSLHLMYRTAPDEHPKSDLQLLPARGSSVCGSKLRLSKNHPLPDGIVGKSRPVGSETSNKSRGFYSIISYPRFLVECWFALRLFFSGGVGAEFVAI
jgi:hypothetical protein